jgi:hypothetical protein
VTPHVALAYAGQLHNQQEPQEQQQDWDSLLGVVLVTAAKADPSEDGSATTAAVRALHKVSKKHLGAARFCIRRLSLVRYKRGCIALQRAMSMVEAPSPALAAAAAAPPVPWDLLTATPSLTWLKMDASQAQHLASDPPAAAAVASGAAAAASDVLAATLGRLRRLRVISIQDSSQVAHLGRLLRAATGLTQLVLELYPANSVDPSNPCGPLLEEMQATQPAATAAAAAAAGGGAAGEVDIRCPRHLLPALRHLEVPVRFLGLLKAWLGQQGVAAQLTHLSLSCAAAGEVDLDCLTACRGLQQLVVKNCDADRPMQLPADLSRVTTLTSLELPWWHLPEVAPVVWTLTQLRQLSLPSNNLVGRIPSDISCLRQLQQLDISAGYVEELPQQLGAWLPQLEGLEVGSTGIATLPPGLTRLTRLGADRSWIVRVESVAALVGLKDLDLTQCSLQQPLQALSCLTA